MILNDHSASKTAEFLLQIKSIILQPNAPFTWASGWKSPIYCDNRKTLSYPSIRTYIRQELSHAITEQYGKPDVIAGVATGGIPQGVLVAQDLGVPFIYVRPQPKEHGLSNQIEGVLEEGQTVVVIEDLVSTGKSSLSAIKKIREAGGHIKGMAAIFTYNFATAEAAFKKEKCPLVTLTSYDHLIERAVDNSYISSNDLQSLKAWKADPSSWKPS